MVIITWTNLPEKIVLATPNVGEQEPSHVRQRRHDRILVAGVIRPDVGHEHFHVVVVYACFVRSCDGEVKVSRLPTLDGLTQDVFM